MYDMLKEERECRLGNGFPGDDGWTIISAVCVWGGGVGMNEEKRWGKPLKEKFNLYQIEAISKFWESCDWQRYLNKSPLKFLPRPEPHSSLKFVSVITQGPDTEIPMGSSNGSIQFQLDDAT